MNPQPHTVPDAGFTLVELLVAIVLLSIVGSIGTSLLVASQRSADFSTAEHDAIEEARLGLNRISRELRQAEQIVYTQNEDGPARSETAVTLVSFTADFDGNGCINGQVGCAAANPANPEMLSYCHEPAGTSSDVGRLYILRNIVTADVAACSTLGSPILAGRVDVFRLEYRSAEYRFDTAPTDGITSWRELDAAPAPFGNNNGRLDAELPYVNSIVVELNLDAAADRNYRTQISLRNAS